MGGKRTITIKHTRQEGTLVYGTIRGDRCGEVLAPQNFRGSPNLPVDDALGDPYWYQPHSRRRSADAFRIRRVREQLEALGFVVEVVVDDTTPATGFDDLEAERNERADARAARYSDRAGRAETESEGIRTKNRRTLDALNGTPILIGHYSERRHRNLLKRVWNSEGRAWELYDKAEYWRQRTCAAERFQHRREDPGTTQRRIAKLEKRLRDIGRRMDGREDWLWDNPGGSSGSLESQLAKYAAREVPTKVLGRKGESVLVHLGVSPHTEAVLAAEVAEITEEISYWEGVLEASGVKIWTKADFSPGDFVNAGGRRWYEVVRANARSLSVAGLHDTNMEGTVITAAAHAARYRGGAAPQKLAYDQVRGHKSAGEIRAEFPEAFGQDDAVPARPKKKGGRTRLEHRPGAEWENWYFEIAGKRYRANWPHPKNWFSRDAGSEPLADEIAPVRVYEEAATLGARPVPTGREIKVPSPLRYIEEVHNAVRAYVEQMAKDAKAS